MAVLRATLEKSRESRDIQKVIALEVELYLLTRAQQVGRVRFMAGDIAPQAGQGLAQICASLFIRHLREKQSNQAFETMSAIRFNGQVSQQRLKLLDT